MTFERITDNPSGGVRLAFFSDHDGHSLYLCETMRETWMADAGEYRFFPVRRRCLHRNIGRRGESEFSRQPGM